MVSHYYLYESALKHDDERKICLSKGGSYKTRKISYHKLCLIVYRCMILTFFDDLVDYMLSTNLFPEFHAFQVFDQHLQVRSTDQRGIFACFLYGTWAFFVDRRSRSWQILRRVDEGSMMSST